MKEETELDLEISVTEEEIQSCLDRAAAIEKELETEAETQQETKYIVYKKEVEAENEIFVRG